MNTKFFKYLAILLLGMSLTAGTAQAVSVFKVQQGGTGSSTGSITGSTALNFSAGGTNQNITLTPSGTGQITINQTAANNNVPLVLLNNTYLGIQDSGATVRAVIGLNSSNNTVVNAYAGQNVTFSIALTEKARISTGGNLLLGGLTTDGTGVLQFPAATTAAGGITFGTDANFFRSAAGELRLTGGTVPVFLFSSNSYGGIFNLSGTSGTGFYWNGSGAGASAIIQTNNTTALTLDSSQEMTIGTGKRILFGGTGASITGSTGGQSLTFTSGSNVAFLSNTTFLVGTDNVLNGTAPLQVNKHSIATTSTDGFVISNRTVSTNGVPVQMPARIRLSGTAWDTAASQTVDFFIENLPASAATPTGTLKFGYSLNSAAATYPITLTSAGNLNLLGKASTYNNVTTAGWGVPAIYGANRATGQTAANASVSTYTVGAADGSFEVSANVLVTTSSAENFTVTVAYTDEGNTARTLTLNFQTIAAVIGTAINFANGAVPYEGLVVHIRAKASTAITVKTVGTFTGATYNVEGIIKQTS